MAKVNLTIDLNEKQIIDSTKAEIRKEIISIIKNDLETVVKGRKVVIEGLIESAVREEVKNFIRNDKEIKEIIINRFKSFSSSNINDLIKDTLGDDFKTIVSKIAEEKIKKLASI